MCISIGHLSALCQEIVSPLSNWESDTLGNTQIRRPLWERMAFSRTNCPYPSDIPANGSANGSSPREKFLGTSENTRWKLRWVEEVGPQPESRAIANAKWLRDNFCLSSWWWSKFISKDILSSGSGWTNVMFSSRPRARLGQSEKLRAGKAWPCLKTFLDLGFVTLSPLTANSNYSITSNSHSGRKINSAKKVGIFGPTTLFLTICHLF